MKLRELIVASFFAAILYLQQVVLSGLPNIHLCAVLIILYAVYFPRLVLPSVFVFVLLEREYLRIRHLVDQLSLYLASAGSDLSALP